MRRKGLIAGTIVAAVVLFGGCGADSQSSGETEQGAQESTEMEVIDEEDGTEALTAVDAENSAAEESATEEKEMDEAKNSQTEIAADNGYTIPDVSVKTYELPDSEALDFVKDMKIGWNLGNTFDAISDTSLSNEMDYESYWCGVVTTKEMIDGIKSAGFHTLRVPVSWHNHVTEDGKYTISDVWMDRVQEVVDYGIENDMYVIINIHHDNEPGYMYPSSEHIEQSKEYVAAVWRQVAERFKDYDEHLIMESLNEPRLKDTENEWWLDLTRTECVEAVQYINELNQVFVDTVRASGGSNEERYLLVPGYCGSVQGVTNEYFQLPQDSTDNKILVEVHAYTPYNFALQSMNEAGSTSEWSMNRSASVSEINSLMENLYNMYVKNGVGVVIDEFGAMDKNDNTQARIDFATYYVANARAKGITCCWWDNNAFLGNGENFGIFQRKTCSILYPELVEGMMKYCE